VPTRNLVLVLLLAAACSREGKTPNRASASDEPAGQSATPEEDAAILGRELYDLIDQAMSYKSAHRGRAPKSLRELGVDELTPTTQRTLVSTGGELTVTVEFRRLDGHALHNCRGTGTVLEEAAISAGDFSLICTTVSGGSTTVKARR
jgi:hypothetical protein